MKELFIKKKRKYFRKIKIIFSFKKKRFLFFLKRNKRLFQKRALFLVRHLFIKKTRKVGNFFKHKTRSGYRFFLKQKKRSFKKISRTILLVPKNIPFQDLRIIFNEKILAGVMILSLVLNQSFLSLIIIREVSAQEIEKVEMVVENIEEEDQIVEEEEGDEELKEADDKKEETVGEESGVVSEILSQNTYSCEENEEWDDQTEKCVLSEPVEGTVIQPEVFQEEEKPCISDCPVESEIVNENEANIGNEIKNNSESGNNEIISESGSDEIENTDNIDSAITVVENENTEAGIKIEMADMEVGNSTYQTTEGTDQTGEVSCLGGKDQTDITIENSEKNETGEQNDIGVEETLSNEPADENQKEEDKNQQTIYENIIETGDASAGTAVVNEVNTNIVGSNWIELILNVYNFQDEEINLLNYLEEVLKAFGVLDKELLDVENVNQADIENVISSYVNSGKNSVEDDGGLNDSLIETGDAYANNQVVNIANRNLVGNNWVFVVVNILGWFQGNLVVPGEGLAQFPGSEKPFEVEVTNDNEAEIENDVQSLAVTGDNEVAISNNQIEKTSDEIAIETGGAQSSSSVIDVINTNIISNNWFQLIINNTGFWWGGVLGWLGESSEMGGYFYEFESAQETIANGLRVYNKNSTSVKNILMAEANTGGNSIDQKGGNAYINTGDASAFNSVINLINTNIVGNNWMFVAVNVLGLWEGDLVFAYPDLEISIDDGNEELKAGNELDYNIVLKNIGKARADNVAIQASIKEEGSEGSAGKYFWSFESLGPGEEKKVSLSYQSGLLEGEIQAMVNVISKTKEINLENNQDTDLTKIYFNYDKAPVENEHNDFEDSLKVKRLKLDGTEFKSGDLIYHWITVENNGQVPLYDIEVKDRVNIDGYKIVDYIWPLGDMNPGDKLLVEYQLLVNPTSNSGYYEYIASAQGSDHDEKKVRSNKTSTAVYLLGGYWGAYGSENEQDGNPFEVVSTAQAFDQNKPAVLGALSYCGNLPLWIWISAFVSYFLAINWSLFPSAQEGNRSSFLRRARFYGVPIVFNLLLFYFVARFWCNDIATWLLFLSLLSFALQLQVKMRGFVRSRISRTA